MNSVSDDSEEESVSQFFHILGAVDQQRGCCDLGDAGRQAHIVIQLKHLLPKRRIVGQYAHRIIIDNEVTLFTACCNADRGIYYYTTYDNHQISAVDMRREHAPAVSKKRQLITKMILRRAGRQAHIVIFRNMETMENHHAMIGMAYVPEDEPLYYDAVNEAGHVIAVHIKFLTPILTRCRYAAKCIKTFL